jgi:hypothetical protein
MENSSADSVTNKVESRIQGTGVAGIETGIETGIEAGIEAGNQAGIENENLVGANEDDPKRPLPLRAVYPKLYDVFVARLEDEHLHAYDAKAVLTRAGDLVTITVFTGDNFERQIEGTFTHIQMETLDDLLVEFIESAASQCRAFVQDDYRAFMKVQP